MIDKKEFRDSIIPVNKHVAVLFEEIEQRKSKGGILIPSSIADFDVTFKGEKIYKVRILRKADNCSPLIPDSGYALINQLSGFGIRTIEPGYVKLVKDTSILMMSKTKEFTEKSICPGVGRALVKVTSKLVQTESGIIIPKGAQETVSYDAATLGGVVVSVSEDIIWLKIGVEVRFDCYMGTEIHIGDDEYRLVLEDEILAEIVNNAGK